MLNVLSLAPGMKENFTLFICPFDLTIYHNPRLFTSELQKHAPPIYLDVTVLGTVFNLPARRQGIRET